jgi:hypothetical protein
VINTNDAGSGSLRQAILNANAAPGLDTIVFDSTVFATPQTIILTSGELLVTQDVIITGPGAGLLTVRHDPNPASNDFRLFDFNFPSGGPGATLSDMTITGGRTMLGGGAGVFGHAAESVTIQNTVITGNSASREGGGLYVGYGTALTVRSSTISGNTAGVAGGAVSARGNLDVESSTISGDAAASQGGGIALYNNFSDAWTVRNSTITGNIAGTRGGGVMAVGVSAGTTSLTIHNSTIASNTANGTGSAQGGGGVGVDAGFISLTIESTIVANNMAASAFDVLGPVTANFSLILNPAGSMISGSNNLLGADPRLGPLANNGGPTQTMSLLSGSPAINAGSNPDGLSTDQRGPGFRRVVGAAADIGAFEAPIVVTNVNDSGSGSLRDAITQANVDPVADIIVFDPTFFGTPRTISLLSALPAIGNPVTITGPGADLLTVRRDPAATTSFRIFDMTTTGTFGVTLSGMTITGGVASADGGGVRVTAGQSVVVENSVVTGNSAAGPGGGLSVSTAGRLNVLNSTISANVAGTNTAFFRRSGGGIASVSGSLYVEASTVSGNTAPVGGGGIYLYNGLTSAIAATIRNSTVSGNTTGTSGGGLLVQTGGSGGLTVLIQNSTIAANTANGTAAGQGGGGIAIAGTGPSVSIASTVVANNTNTRAPDVVGPVTAGFSLIRNQTGAMITDAGNNLAAGTDPLFAAAGLTNNGGPTQTIALQPTSPLIDRGSNPANLATDERGAGFARVAGPAADIGAFEVQSSVSVQSLMIDNGTAQRSMVRSVTVTFSGLVSFAGPAANAFQLTRTGPGTPNGNVTIAADLSGSTATQTVARLTFSGPLSEGANSLIDGRYTLAVLSSQVQGGLQGGDNVTNLFRYYGDVNGDGTVNGLDLALFRNAFGTSLGNPNYVDYLDQNGDGTINGLDLAVFRTHFGTTLP